MNRLIKHRAHWHTVVCVAGGPSLTLEQLEVVHQARQAERVRVIGVNNAFQRAPWIDVVYACDLLWWKKHHAQVKALAPGAETVTQDASAHKQFALSTRVRGSAGDGLGREQIHTGGNGGHAAVNLAYLWGAQRILLLGYDMQLGPKGERHWHPDHPSPCIQTQLFAHWIKRFESTARDLKKLGVEVLNCTPGSALPWFPRCSIDEALATTEQAEGSPA
jgi:hypothetical protein